MVEKSRGFGLNAARGENLGLGVAGECGSLGLGVAMLAFSVGLVYIPPRYGETRMRFGGGKAGVGLVETVKCESVVDQTLVPI